MCSSSNPSISDSLFFCTCCRIFDPEATGSDRSLDDLVTTVNMPLLVRTRKES